MNRGQLTILRFAVSIALLPLSNFPSMSRSVEINNYKVGSNNDASTIYITLAWERSREASTISSGSIGASIEAGRQLPTYSDFVWDNGTFIADANLRAVPHGYRWASWQQKYPVDVRHLKGTFMLPLSLDSTAKGILFDPYYSSDIVPINDNIYVYVNGTLKLQGGTNYGAPNGGFGGTSALANETDGWYIPSGISLNGFKAGVNVVDIVVEERQIWGGLGYLMLRFGPRTSKVPIPFLDLPFDYSYTNFATASQGRSVGRVNSWFDHRFPNYGKDYEITTWQGNSITYTAGPPKNPNNNCEYGISCYAGHNGIDFAHKTDNDVITTAASGTVISTTINPLKTNCKDGDISCGGGYGNQVWLDHDNGYATIYGHLKTVSVSVGLSVTASQSLGIMGNTGNSHGTHLHFGLYYDKNADSQWTSNEVVDPYGWFGQEVDPWNTVSQYMWQKPLAEQKGVSVSGATLDTPSGDAKVIIPPNAVTSTVTAELWGVPSVAPASSQLRSTGRSVWLRVLDWIDSNSPSLKIRDVTTTFFQPITITINYSDTETLHLDKDQLSIYRWSENSGTWIGLSTTLRLEQNQVIAQSMEAGHFDVQAPLLCPADTQEPNDSYYAASMITSSGMSQVQLFDVAQDEDWFKLDAMAGGKYVISTSNMATQMGTVLQVYDIDGLNLLASDGNTSSLIASRLTWSTPASGSYFLRVIPVAGSDFGCNASYSIAVTQMLPTFLPFVQR